MILPATPHIWYTPADCSALLLGMQQGGQYRAPCPVCQSSRTDALSIRQMPDKYGHPCTVFHCFAHGCDVRDICAALGIELRNLFSVHPDYARETRTAPRAKSPRIDRLKTMEEPTPEEIAQILLEEMIVSDPQWIQECTPARQKMWNLASASPKAKEALTKALYEAHLSPRSFWQTLAVEMGG
jgi:hypothetical protein